MSAPVPRRPGGGAKRVARALAWPVRRYFGTQFDWTRAQVIETDHRLLGRLDGHREEQREAREALHAELAELRHGVTELHHGVAELHHRVAELHHRVAELQHGVAELRGAVAMSALSGTEALAGVGHELRLLGDSAGRAADGAPPGSAMVTAVVAAQAARALTGLPAGTRVLVTGEDAGPAAQALAVLGHRVTTLGARPGEAPHPGVTAVAEGFERWRPPTEPFDGAVVLAVPEPGAGATRDGSGAAWARAEALEHVHALLRPGAPLVLAWSSAGDEDPPLAPERWEGWDEGPLAPPSPGGWALRILRARATGGPAPE